MSYLTCNCRPLLTDRVYDKKEQVFREYCIKCGNLIAVLPDTHKNRKEYAIRRITNLSAVKQSILDGEQDTIVQEVVSEEMKIGEVASKISFRSTPTVTIEYDPNAEVTEKQGQGGNTFLQVEVKVDGRKALLPVSQRLLTKLQPFRTPCKLKIERTGDGFATDYSVTQVK